MNRTKNDDYYLDKLKTHFERISNVMDNITYEMYLEDEDKQDITMFHLIQISENAKQLSEEFKESKPNVPWIDIYGLRNRIVHDYGNVVLDIVYETLTKDIPELARKLFK